MKKIQKKFFCRACNSYDNISNLTEILPKRFNQFFLFSYRGFNSSSIFCKNCGSLSFFNLEELTYKSGDYRNKGDKKLPIDLPWSTITYKRHQNILKYVETYLPKLKNSDIKILDFGGYNGFCSYGICENLSIPFANAYIADLDPNGLSIASSLGLSIYDLGIKNLTKHLENNDFQFSLITAVQVLEHLKNPSKFFIEIKKHIRPDGIVYVEIPSNFFFPLSDKSHLTTFSKEGIIKLAHRNGFITIKNKTQSTPKESVLYGYPLSSKYENQIFIFKLAKEIKIYNDDKIKKNSYSLSKFIFKALISDIFLRVIVIKNYSHLLNKTLKSIIKSILILICTPFFLFCRIIYIFFAKLIK